MVKKKTIALGRTSRLEEIFSYKKAMQDKIEEEEAYVLSYKKNSAQRFSGRSMSRMSGSIFSNGSRYRESSPHAEMRIFNRLRNNKSFKSSDSEYAFMKEFVISPIDNEDFIERNKQMSGDLNFKELYDTIMYSSDLNLQKKALIWSGQDILGNYNLDHMEKIIGALNLNEFKKYLEEIKFRVMFYHNFYRNS